MLCLECNHPVRRAALVVAMEQRDHIGFERHAEVCHDCAMRLHERVAEAITTSRHRFQSVDCAACGDKHPAIRLRFELGAKALHHVALCGHCYTRIRPDLLAKNPNLVRFVDTEWETHATGHARQPWPVGTHVSVKPHVVRFHGMTGIVQSFRGLVIPYFGYDVRFDATGHHFFHERDLDRAE